MQPQYQQVPMQGPSQFMSSLFGCFDDLGVCLEGYFCHCVTSGRVKAAVDGQPETIDPTCCIAGWCFPACTQCSLRGTVRQKYNIEGGAVGDCCTAFCCTACSVCQLANEMNRRGVNTGALCIQPSLGPQKMG